MSVSSEHSPFFSVITPTFNRARTLPRAVSSVIAQTFEDWEYIIIDDGSTDDTSKIVDQIVKQKQNIKYYHIPNGGTARARDFGASMATGRFITFLDSDDEYLPTHLESRYHVLSAHPGIELLHGGVEIIGDEYVADKHDPQKKIPIIECAIGGTFFIRRDLFSRVGGFGSILYGDDRDFFDRAIAKGAT